MGCEIKGTKVKKDSVTEKVGLFGSCFVVPVYLGSGTMTCMKPYRINHRALEYSRAGRDFRDHLAVLFHLTDKKHEAQRC